MFLVINILDITYNKKREQITSLQRLSFFILSQPIGNSIFRANNVSFAKIRTNMQTTK